MAQAPASKCAPVDGAETLRDPPVRRARRGRRTEGGRARRRRDRRGARPPGGSSPCRNPAASAVRAGADGTLFEWLTTLYRPWSNMDAEVVSGAATAALGWLAKSGCTASTDHH